MVCSLEEAPMTAKEAGRMILSNALTDISFLFNRGKILSKTNAQSKWDYNHGLIKLDGFDPIAGQYLAMPKKYFTSKPIYLIFTI